MKIYTSKNSNFGMRVLIATRAKNIEIESLPLPAGGLKSPDYMAVNPIAKIPVLVTESGTVLPESVVILNYLEDRFPTPSLRPRDPEQRARVDLAIRIMDTYVMAPVIRLFPHLDPANRNEEVVAREVKHWEHGVSVLAHFMQSPLPEAEAGLTLADCALPPCLHLSTRIAAMIGLEADPATAHGVLSDYYARTKTHQIIGPVLAELTETQAAYDIKSGRPSLAERH